MGYIKDTIKDYYEKKPNKTYEGDLLSPSMLGGCARVMYYKLRGVKETTPPDTNAQQNFEVGNLWEAQIADYIDEAGDLIYWWIDGQSKRHTFLKENWKGELRTDKWIDKQLGIAGTPDIVYKQKDKIVLLDVKTMKANASRWIVNQSNEEYFAEHEQYQYQLGAYLLMMERRFKAGLEKHLPEYGKLVIISKDTGAIIKEPTLKLTDELKTKVVKRILYLKGFLERNELPPCECKGWQINYCGYGDVDSIKPNKQKKLVPTKCCSEHLINN